MARANVPKFGNWESEDNVPYTVYFDKARKTKGGKNPNDPQENPEMLENVDSSPLAPANAHVPPSRPRNRPEEPIVKGAVKPTSEHGPAQNENTSRKAASESNYGSRRPKPNRSPMPSHQGSQGTTGKSRMRPANLGDDSPDQAAAVPRFGDWENDPQSAENFSDIFQKVREERNAGPGNVSTAPKHPSYPTRGQASDQPKRCCCPWW